MTVVLLTFTSGCRTCDDSPDYYLMMEKVKTFETKNHLYDYFNKLFNIDKKFSDGKDSEKIKYLAFIEDRFNHGFKYSRTDTETICTDCGFIYIYGDKIKNVQLSSPCDYLKNITPLLELDLEMDEKSDY
jgi:hypothetical protein